MSNPLKGWSRNQAYTRASLRRMQESIYRSEFHTICAFDTEWSEWVTVTSHPSAPITMQRKPRPGLRRERSYRILTREQLQQVKELPP